MYLKAPITFLFSLSLALVFSLGTEDRAYSQDAVFWVDDIKTASRLAYETDRLVLIHFYGDHCAPCKKMDMEVFSRRDVASMIDGSFVAVKVNVTNNPKIAKDFQIKSIPQDIVMTYDGKILDRRDKGGISADNFIRYLNKNEFQTAGTSRKSTVNNHLAALDQRENRQVYPQHVPSNVQQIAPPIIVPPIVVQPEPTGLIASAPIEQPTPIIPKYESNAAMASTVNINPYPEVRHAVSPENKTEDNNVRLTSVQGEPQKDAITAIIEKKEQRPSDILGLALEGFCPVELVESDNWVRGDGRICHVEQGIVFVFSSIEAKNKFVQNPAKYKPARFGCDVVQWEKNKTTTLGVREFGIRFREKTYLFSSRENLELFFNNPLRYAEL